MLKVFSEGAEAKIYQTRIFGKTLLLKARERKAYRIEQLDVKLRSTRTKKEARIMQIAYRQGANVPKVVAYGAFEIYMEKLDGMLLRDMKNAKQSIFVKCGEELAKLHKAGVVHGDFTPANIIVSKEKVFVIDFGLAEQAPSLEERAIDVLLFKRSVTPKQFEAFLMGYKKFEKSGEVIERLKEIEKRGRYQERTIANVNV